MFKGTTKVKQPKLISGHLGWIHQHKKNNHFCTKMDFHSTLLQDNTKREKEEHFSPHFGCKAKLPASKWVQLQVSLIIGNSEDFNFVIDYVFCVLPWRPTTPYENDKQVRQTHSTRGRSEKQVRQRDTLHRQKQLRLCYVCGMHALQLEGFPDFFFTNSYILVLERYWAFSFKGC